MSPHARHLRSGERVHLVTREHGVVLARPFLLAALVLALVGLAAERTATAQLPLPLRGAALAAAALVAAVVLLRLAAAVARWQRRTMVVTDHRVLLLNGRRRLAALPLGLVEEVEIACTAAGRALHYGTVMIGVGGRRSPLLGLRRLPDPDLLLALLLGLDEGIAPPAGGAVAAGAV